MRPYEFVMGQSGDFFDIRRLHQTQGSDVSRAERNIIALFLAVSVAISLFFISWWAAAALSLYHLLPISDSVIGLAALTGAVVGIVLNVFYLRRWIAKFYLAHSALTMMVYVFWSVIAVALFMGLPLGNILLGMLAGLYTGRKMRFLGAPIETLSGSARKVGLFTAGVTGLEMILIGILGLREDFVQRIFQSTIGLAPASTMGLPGIALVMALCFVLMGVQFWLTRLATLFSFGGDQSSAV